MRKLSGTRTNWRPQVNLGHTSWFVVWCASQSLSKGVARIWFRGGTHLGGGAPISGGGGTHFGGGGRPPVFRLRPQITRVPLMYFWLPPDFGGRAPPPWLRP